MKTLLSLHPNYMSKPTSSWSFLDEAGKSQSSCPDGLQAPTVTLFLASSCFPPWLSSYPHSHIPTLLTFVLYTYNLKPFRTAPKIRISLVISHLFHLFHSSLSPCFVSGIGKQRQVRQGPDHQGVTVAVHISSNTEAEASEVRDCV